MGFTVFVDDELKPWPDQWEALARIDSLTRVDLDCILQENVGEAESILENAAEIEELILESTVDGFSLGIATFLINNIHSRQK